MHFGDNENNDKIIKSMRFDFNLLKMSHCVCYTSAYAFPKTDYNKLSVFLVLLKLDTIWALECR